MAEFTIYNYLNATIVAECDGTYIATVGKKSASIIPKKIADLLTRGKVLKIFFVSKHNTKIPYTQYLIDTPTNERIRNLHIGMITTRYLGSTDMLNTSQTNANAGQGCAWINIHNLTNVPLKVNVNRETIEIPAHKVYRHKGVLNMGVPLGSVFTASDPYDFSYELLKPYSDIFYGVTSDIKQSLDGCWQTEFSDRCDYGQTMWPFQEGIM